MRIACLDLEGVLAPEIWVNVARATGIDELKVTTRDIADYDELMGYRLKICAEHRLSLANIQDVIATLKPLEGAVDFLGWLSERCQVIILSDTFYQFADPIMAQLGRPTLFAHDLVIDDAGMIVDYRLRLADQKRKAVEALKTLNFTTIATGDSFNDVSMLISADAGILFNPAPALVEHYPDLAKAYDYDELREQFIAADKRLS